MHSKAWCNRTRYFNIQVSKYIEPIHSGTWNPKLTPHQCLLKFLSLKHTILSSHSVNSVVDFVFTVNRHQKLSHPNKSHLVASAEFKISFPISHFGEYAMSMEQDLYEGKSSRKYLLHGTYVIQPILSQASHGIYFLNTEYWSLK